MRKILLTLLSGIALYSYSTAQTYCSAVSGGGACITNVTFNTTLNRTSAGCENSPNYYTSVPVGTATTTITGGQTYSLSVTVDTVDNAILSVWIDYDHNGTFDASEWNQIATNALPSSTSTISVVVPGNAVAGQTAMRIRSRMNGSSNGATDACTTFYSGEAEDYVVTIVAAPACSGTPTAGTATASSDTVCSGVDFDLVLTGYSTGISGLTFQWQSSATGLPGTYTNISGATSPIYTVSQTSTTVYQCIVTCGGSSAASSFVIVGMNDFMNCYCTSTATSTADEDIFNVTVGTLNNTSSCTTTGGTGSVLNEYSDYTAVAAPNLAKGVSIPFSVQVGTCGTGSYDNAVKIYIDYNQNGSFAEAGDLVYTSAVASGAHTVTGSFTVPLTATSGNTLMRVVCRETTDTSTISSCGTYSWGETEDYMVNVTTGTACSGTPIAGTATASADSVCSESFDLILTGYTQGVSGLTFQWQSSSTGTTGTFTNITGAANPTYTATQTATTYYQCIVTCSGSSATSTVVSVMSLPAIECYCTSNATNTSDEDIFNVTVSTLNNTSSCTTTGGTGSLLNKYSNYTSLAAPNLVKGDSVNLSIQIGTCDSAYFYKNAVKVYIDYNQNGSFAEAIELVYASDTALGPQIVTGSFTVPLTATNGNTLMRVVCRETTDTSTISACGTYGYGETEDYTVNITGAVGITEIGLLNNVILYPNPSNGLFYIVINNANFNQLMINVIDIQGKTVYSTVDKNLSSNYNKQINLEGLAKGLYYIKLSTESGVKVQKLIVQ